MSAQCIAIIIRNLRHFSSLQYKFFLNSYFDKLMHHLRQINCREVYSSCCVLFMITLIYCSLWTDLLLKYEKSAIAVLPQIGECLEIVQDPKGLAAIIWIIGEYGQVWSPLLSFLYAVWILIHHYQDICSWNKLSPTNKLEHHTCKQ